MIKLTSWDVFGKYYGFPQCCISEFHTDIHQLEGVPRKLNGSGYIPCSACNEKTEEELIATINSNRFEAQAFPYESRHQDAVDYILTSPHFTPLECELVLQHVANVKKSDEDDALFDNHEYYYEICTESEAVILSGLVTAMQNDSGDNEDSIFYQIIELLRAKEEMLSFVTQTQ